MYQSMKGASFAKQNTFKADKFIYNLVMLKYLIQLPCEVLGQNILGYLDLINIIQLENAASNHKFQQLMKAILPYCPHLHVIGSDPYIPYELKRDGIVWFNKRCCRAQFVRISVLSLGEIDFEYFELNIIELCLYKNTSLNDIAQLYDPNISQRITQVQIRGFQDPAVMEVFFSLPSNSCVLSLDIKLYEISK